MIMYDLEVIRMENSAEDDFYRDFEEYLYDDEISAEEEGFMKGFTDSIFDE